MFRSLISITFLCLVANTANSALITSTVGDVDCFGLGGTCADGDLWRDGLGGSFFTDYRDAGDLATASHTDIWDSPNSPSWTHSYNLGAGSPVTAYLDLFIAGFADIGAVSLFADNTLIATYDFPGQFQTVHALTAAVPLALLDGSTAFSLNAGGGDGFIIDHSTLRIDTSVTSVPEPLTVALMGLGLIGIGISRRKKIS